MTPTESVPTKASMAGDGHHIPDPIDRSMIDDLRELITALDRRVPRFERTGEIGIAHDAAALRDKALERIAELENSRL